MGRRHVSKRATKLAGDPAIKSHAYKRMDRMTLMGLSLPKLIDIAHITPAPPTLECAGASLQAGKGSRDDRTEAAHNLPRDLLVNGKAFWSYADTLQVDPRIKLQMFYAPAATVTVSRASNYLDSCWEKMGLPDDWLTYLRKCVGETKGIAPGTLEIVTNHAGTFRHACEMRLEQTFEAIKTRDYYTRNEDEISNVYDIYQDVVAEYPPAARLQTLWSIYQLPRYS